MFIYYTMSPSPPSCRPPIRLIVKKKGEVPQKSFFNLAENCDASSIWVGRHRYMRLLQASKRLWV